MMSEEPIALPLLTQQIPDTGSEQESFSFHRTVFPSYFACLARFFRCRLDIFSQMRRRARLNFRRRFPSVSPFVAIV
jgi:hypothetical protein